MGLRTWWYKRKVRKARGVLMTLDVVMYKAGYSRKDRRRFWRDFVKSSNFRLSVLTEKKGGGMR